LRSYERGLLVWSLATRAGAPNRAGFYARWGNPIGRPLPRTATSVAGWSVEGRAGAALSVDRSVRRHLGFGADPHAGFDVVWMATTDLAYPDRGLWDDAGTLAGGPWVSTRVPLGDGGALLTARLGARAGALYWNPGRGVVSRDRYDFAGFGRLTGEASVRAPFRLGTTLGVRLYGGAFVGSSPPVRQRRILVAGADPYETFTNPLLRSRGALLVRPDFHYHAPGGANLRGFRADLGGRWALAANVEVARSLLKRPAGILQAVALEAFVDAGLVDTLAVRSSPPGRWYTTLYDGGVGLVTRQQIRELDWTMRFELPLVVNRSDRAADFRAGDGRLAFRWLVSMSPSF